MRHLLAGLALWLAVATAAAAAPPLDPSRLAAVSPPPFARAPMDAAFLDQHGRRVTLGALAGGKPLVLIPVQHGCQSLCGLTLQSLQGVIARQPLHAGADFTLVAFGIDPRETPSDAARSAERLGGPGVEALVGDQKAIAGVTRALGYRYSWIPESAQYAHISAVAVLGSDGRLVRWLPGLGLKPGDLQSALAKAGRGEAGGVFEQIRLLCFHFDPATGRRTLAVWRLAQAAAGGGALLLAAGVGVAFWRERRRGASA